MGLKKFISASLFSIVLVFNSSASEIPDRDEVQKVVDTIVPGSKVVDVSKTPIDGLYEVIIKNDRGYMLFYIDKPLKHIVSGAILDIEKGKNLTEERIKSLNQFFLRDRFRELAGILGAKKSEKLMPFLSQREFSVVDLPLPPKNVVVEGNPYGSKVLYVITDPECPYCRMFNDELKKLIKMDRKIKIIEILLPLPYHRYAKGVALAVLCQTDREKARKLLNKAFENQKNYKVLKEISKHSCDNGEEILRSHINFIKKLNVRATPSILIPLNEKKGLLITGGISAKDLKTLLDIIYN